MARDLEARIDEAQALVALLKTGTAPGKTDTAEVAALKKAHREAYALIQTALAEMGQLEPIRCETCAYCHEDAQAYCRAWHRHTDPRGYCYRRRIAETELPKT